MTLVFEIFLDEDVCWCCENVFGGLQAPGGLACRDGGNGRPISSGTGKNRDAHSNGDPVAMWSARRGVQRVMYVLKAPVVSFMKKYFRTMRQIRWFLQGRASGWSSFLSEAGFPGHK